MKSNRKVFLFALLLVCVAISLGYLCWPAKAHRQDAKAQGKPKPVEQRMKIVPDVAPSGLADEIKKLNEEGYYISSANLLIVGDKITIVVSDEDIPEENDEEGEGR